MSVGARFTGRCPACGEVALLAEQMWLVLTNVPGRDHYGFHCPDCGRTHRHTADAATVGLLSALLPVETLDLPAEALEVHTGPAITIDDVLDAMLTLEHPGHPGGGTPGLSLRQGGERAGRDHPRRPDRAA
jgi:predicted RNA-binding Zn-ribbon protein involved in translation (DUF1610 family)